MALLSDYRGNVRLLLKGYLFFGVALLILAMLIYSNHLIGRMKTQTEAESRLFARLVGNTVFEVDDEGKAAVLQETMADITLPVIVTWRDGRPIAWRRVPVADMVDEDWKEIETMDPRNPPPGKMTELMKLVEEFDRINPPVPVRIAGMDDIQGWVHFGNSKLQGELRFMPFIQLGLFLVFMGVAIQGFRYLKIGEQRSIWVGMAKETAHQLGTPLSALIGWVELIKAKAEEKGYDEIENSLSEMEVDVGRLSKVTERFSKIGSQPELREVAVEPILERTVTYFHRRLPRLKSNSTLSLEMENTPPVRGNEELLEWVFENLIKNGLDALGDRGGKIRISSSYRLARKQVEILVKDTGRGIPSAHRERIFRPGFTTKKRGWGMGLALTRRIVEEYHGGTLKLVETRAGKGTTFAVRLPVA